MVRIVLVFFLNLAGCVVDAQETPFGGHQGASDRKEPSPSEAETPTHTTATHDAQCQASYAARGYLAKYGNPDALRFPLRDGKGEFLQEGKSYTIVPTHHLEFYVGDSARDWPIVSQEDLCKVTTGWEIDVASTEIELDPGTVNSHWDIPRWSRRVVGVGGLVVDELNTEGAVTEATLAWYLRRPLPESPQAIRQILGIPPEHSVAVNYVEPMDHDGSVLAVGLSGQQGAWPRHWSVMPKRLKAMLKRSALLGLWPAPRSADLEEALRNIRSVPFRNTCHWDALTQQQVMDFVVGQELGGQTANLLHGTLEPGGSLAIHFVWQGNDNRSYLTSALLSSDGSVQVKQTQPFSSDLGTGLPSVEVLQALDPTVLHKAHPNAGWR